MGTQKKEKQKCQKSKNPKKSFDPTFPRLYNMEEAAEVMNVREKRPNEEWTGDKIRYWVDTGALKAIEMGKNKRFLTDGQLRKLQNYLIKHPTAEPRHLLTAGVTIEPGESASRVIGVEDVMQILGIKSTTFKKMKLLGEIVAAREGHPLVFDRLVIEALAAQKRQEAENAKN